MENDNQELLEKLLRLTEENNVMLRRIQSRARWGTIFRVAYWVLLIGLSIGAFYFIQPYIEAVTGGVNEFQNQVNTFKSFVN